MNKVLEFFKENQWSKILLLSIPSLYIINTATLGIFHNFVFVTMLWPTAIFVVVDFFFIKKKKPSIVLWLFLAYYAWVFVEQYRAGLRLNDYHLVVGACVISIIIETYIKDDPTSLLKTYFHVFEIFIYVNLVTLIYNFIIGKPKDPTFLAHHWNLLNPYALAAICIGVLYIKNTGNIKRGSALCLTSLFSMFLVRSVTTNICAFCMVFSVGLMFLIYKKKKDFDFKLWPWAALILFLNFFLIVIYSYSLDKFPTFGSLVITLFKKQPTFTGRTEIWKECISIIRQSPWIGYGDDVEIYALGEIFPHPHNALLRLLIEFGFIGLFLFSCFSFAYIREIDKSRNNIFKILLIAVVFCFYVGSLVESYLAMYLFYLIIFLSCHMDDVPEYNATDKTLD